jgi:hypothetical protein
LCAFTAASICVPALVQHLFMMAWVGFGEGLALSENVLFNPSNEIGRSTSNKEGIRCMRYPLTGRARNRRSYSLLLGGFLLILALATISPSLANPRAVRDGAKAPGLAQATTIITVDTSADLDSGSTRTTCTYTSGAIFVSATDGCTLRRALLEAAARPPVDRPIEIRFNLANDDPNKDLEVSGTWTLPIAATLPILKTQSILDKTGDVTIDGATQPGGRSNGPAIIIATNDRSLEIASTGNTLRNLAFKGGGVIFLNEDNNTVENIWMGLSDDGATVVFRTPGQPVRLAGGGIFIASDNNTVKDNIIVGAFARAINIDGNRSNNTIQGNLIGMRADGTVPAVPVAAQCLRSLSLDPQNWYGGWGIAVSGSNNKVIENRIAGLHILQSANDTPPIAIEIFGSGHEIRDNVIGIDSAGNKVGVCGQGIKVSGSNTQIIDNQITGSRAGFEDDESTAILASDSSPTFGQITVRRNLIERGPGRVYAFGPGIPAQLKLFQPARITSIAGQTVSGTSGFASPCPGCIIDLYSDNADATAETLSYLGEATADGAGNFSLTLSAPLAPGSGIRTSSTTASAGVIGSYLSGTTTQVSKLYLPLSDVTIDGPITGTAGVTQTFTIAVTPLGATVPLTYTVTTSDFNPQSLTSENAAINANYRWTSSGTKTINVTVRNELSEVNAVHTIEITGSAEPEGPKKAYLPLVVR